MESKVEQDLIMDDPSKVPSCKCADEHNIPHLCVLRISKTEKNMDRPFFACSKPTSKGGCGYFCWQDDVVVDMTTGLAKRKYIPPNPDSKKKKLNPESASLYVEESLKPLKEQIEHLQQKIYQLEQQLATLQSGTNGGILTQSVKLEKEKPFKRNGSKKLLD